MRSNVIDTHAELAQATVTPYHRRLCALMAVLTFFDGYDIFNAAYVIHYVAGPWELNPGQAGLLVSSGLFGFLIGAALHGLIADRFGRRVTLLGGLWLMSLFSLATAAWADSFFSYCALRILTGLGMGALFPLATTYVSELAPQRLKNTFVLRSVALGWAGGGMAAGLAGVFVTPWAGWPALYLLGGLSLLVLPWAYRELPESPQFLALRGRDDELRTLLCRLRPERQAMYRLLPFVDASVVVTQGPIRQLLSPRYRRCTLTLWLTAFLGLFCVFGLSGWVPTVMMARGESFASSFGFGALLQVMSFIGALCCGWLSDRRGMGTRALVLWWLIGGAAILGLALFDNHAVNVAGVAAAGFCCIGAMFMLNNVAANLYATPMRASGVGMMLGVGRIGAILGPWIAGLLHEMSGSSSAMFSTIGIASFAAAATLACLPRQRPGRPLVRRGFVLRAPDFFALGNARRVRWSSVVLRTPVHFALRAARRAQAAAGTNRSRVISDGAPKRFGGPQ